MKLILFVSLFVFLSHTNAIADEVFEFLVKSESGDSVIYVFTDPETGCEYLSYFYRGTFGGGSPSLTVRIDSEGNPICNPIKAESESFD